MSKDHLAKAKDYIAKGEDYYRKAAEEIVSWLAEDASRTQAQAAERIGRGRQWVQKLIVWVENGADHGAPFGGPNENEARYERHVKQVLRDPERRRRAIAELDTGDLEEIRKVVSHESEARFDKKLSRRVERPQADWATITGRCYSARRGFEESLSELKMLGREHLSEEVADDLLDTVERTIAAGELLGAFLRGKDMLSEIETFLAEQV